jgi:hypothetical protein
MRRHYDNDDSDFEYINGKKCLRDGKVLRVRTTLMDSASNLTQAIMRDYSTKARTHVSDGGSGDPLWAHKPGYRTYTDAKTRATLSEERAFDRAAYLEDQDNTFRNTSPSWSGNPPTGQGTHNMRGVEDIPEGTACTINGCPGKWQRVNGTMICIPNDRSADSLSIYDAYDLQIADAWRGDAKPKEQDPGEEKEDDETAGDEGEEEEELGAALEAFKSGAIGEAYRQTSTHTESQQRWSVPDRLQRDHEARMRQLQPQLKQWTAAADQIAAAQKARDTIMDAEYGKYDAALQEAWRK